jgi:hypothetical protein
MILNTVVILICTLDSSEDRVQTATLVAPEWTNKEERALIRKLDFRVLLPCCIIYFLAYLGMLAIRSATFSFDADNVSRSCQSVSSDVPQS